MVVSQLKFGFAGKLSVYSRLYGLKKFEFVRKSLVYSRVYGWWKRDGDWSVNDQGYFMMTWALQCHQRKKLQVHAAVQYFEVYWLFFQKFQTLWVLLWHFASLLLGTKCSKLLLRSSSIKSKCFSFGFTKLQLPFGIELDILRYAMGVVLMQEERLVSYYSHLLLGEVNN